MPPFRRSRRSGDIPADSGAAQRDLAVIGPESVRHRTGIEPGQLSAAGFSDSSAEPSAAGSGAAAEAATRAGSPTAVLSVSPG